MSDAPANDTPAWDDKHQQMLTFIGSVCTQLSDLAETVEDEALKEKLLDIADQCCGEFFGNILSECACQTPETEKD